VQIREIYQPIKNGELHSAVFRFKFKSFWCLAAEKLLIQNKTKGRVLKNIE
jgi:hypothetical protein